MQPDELAAIERRLDWIELWQLLYDIDHGRISHDDAIQKLGSDPAEVHDTLLRDKVREFLRMPPSFHVPANKINLSSVEQDGRIIQSTGAHRPEDMQSAAQSPPTRFACFHCGGHAKWKVRWRSAISGGSFLVSCTKHLAELLDAADNNSYTIDRISDP